MLLISHSCFLLLFIQPLAVVTDQLVPRSVLTNSTGEGRMEMGERRRIARQDREMFQNILHFFSLCLSWSDNKNYIFFIFLWLVQNVGGNVFISYIEKRSYSYSGNSNTRKYFIGTYFYNKICNFKWIKNLQLRNLFKFCNSNIILLLRNQFVIKIFQNNFLN